MPKLLKNYPLILLCLFIAIMLLPNLDSMQVTIMEARTSITAREMVTDNNWLLTTMNGVPRYQKPPLPTWITAFLHYYLELKAYLECVCHYFNGYDFR